MATTSTLWGPCSVLNVLGANFGMLWHVEITHPHVISWRLIFQNTPSLTRILPSSLKKRDRENNTLNSYANK